MARLKTLTVAALLGLATAQPLMVSADPYPPDWGAGVPNEATGPIHFAPALWPNEPADPVNCALNCGDWKPYTRFQGDINDPRVQDPSNGGTSPQNYVNVSSSCIDKSYPSIYYYLYHGATPEEDVIMFRWRVEQIANNYATGPSAGNFGATDPWSSALWTVLFDVDGDGYRDIAAHLNGSSGDPSHPVDMLAGIWGNIPTQSIDYLSDPSIHLIAHNPTAFTSGSTILNFQDSLTPTTTWPNGAHETVWDYGTTRAKLVSSNACNEYFVDYQIPVRMLDASPTGPNPALNGPKITRDTPISMLFCTANSLNNPFQKDCSLNKDWSADASQPGPFGDYLSFNQAEPYSQPIVSSVTASGPATCPGTYQLTAKVQDTLALQNGVVIPSVQQVDFYYWYDADGDGLANDAGSTWTRITPSASLKSGTLNTWNASWDATALLKGKYLVAVQAVDDNTLVDDDMVPSGVDNRTFSYLSGDASNNGIYLNGAWVAGQDVLFPAHSPSMTPSATENWYGNPTVTGVQTAPIGVAINACGVAPTVSKAATPSNPTVGETVTFTVTFANTGNPNSVTLASLVDHLPAGFNYINTTGGTLLGSVATAPTGGDSGDITWTFTNPTTVAASGSETLIFTASAASVVGTYNNVVDADSSFGLVTSPPVTVAVGAPRLTIAKSSSVLSASPGDAVTYTITYANDASVAVTNAVITDTLPLGLDFVNVANGGSYTVATRTLTWNVGDLAPGDGPFTVSFNAMVSTPYPAVATVPLVNTASITSDQTAPANASSSIFVDVPRPTLALQKSASPSLVNEGANTTFTISYANTGTGAASNVVISDPLPAGFTYVSSSPAADSAPTVGTNGTLIWNIGSVAAGATGSVSVTATASSPYSDANPAINSATITATENPAGVTAEAQVGVNQGAQLCRTYYLSDTQATIELVGSQYTGTTDVPSGGSTTLQVYIPPNAAPVPEIEVARFYQDPLSPYLVTFDGSSTLSGQIDYTKSSALGGAANSNLTLWVRLYDFNPGDGSETLLGSTSYVDNGSPTPPVDLAAVTPSGSLPKGHRLLWVVSVVMAQNKATTMELQVNSTGSNTEICSPPPANLTLNKAVDKLSALPGDALQYTLVFTNTSGTTAATNAIITDTLPAGVNFVSATLNGSPIAESALGGNAYAFDVGSVAANGSGTLVINATIDAGLSAAVTSVTNNGYIESDQTSPTTPVTATTNITGAGGGSGSPVLVLQKSANLTLVQPGDAVTYTITVLNAGDGDATSVNVQDIAPETSWYHYRVASIAGGDSRNVVGSTLSWTINTLAPGASASLSFIMDADASGLPSGLTVVDNIASVTSTEVGTPVDSNTVTITATTNPYLTIAKSVAPLGTAAPGDLLTYTVAVTNTGSGDATGVVVTDPIPTYTSFSGNIVVSGGGSATFDTVNNRIVYDVGTLTAGATASVAFDVTVDTPLTSGSSTLSNTAAVAASNAGGGEDTVTTSAQAAPAFFLDKSGPAAAPLPAATLTSDASAATLLFVDDISRLSLGQAVRIGSTIARITALGGQNVTLDSAVTAVAGTPVYSSIAYTITWRNTGDANATNVVVSDTLPGSFLYVTATPTATTAPTPGNSGTVTWNLGTVAPGESGTLKVEVIPTAIGSYTNTATLTADGGINLSDPVVTGIGGLVPTKVTSTPYSIPGGSAVYTITVHNTLAVTASGVVVTDLLPSGWTWASTTDVSIGGSSQGAPAASGDANQPQWGPFSIPAGEALVIQFTAAVPASAGAATYQNGVDVTSSNAAVTPFDPLITKEEDVTILADGTGLIEGYVYRDNDSNGLFDPAVDTAFANVLVQITDSVEPNPYEVYTDSSGYFIRVVAAGNADVDVNEVQLPAGLALTTDLNHQGTDPTTVVVPNQASTSDLTGYLGASTADLAVTKDDGVTSVAANGTTTYTIVVSNVGPDAADGTVVTDPAAVGLTKTAVGCSAAGGAACPGALSIAALESGVTIPTLPLGGSVTFTVDANVTAASGSTVTNTASLTLPAGATDPTPADLSASDTDDVTAALDGTITGQLYIDNNGNGLYDAGDTPIVGTDVEITTSVGGTITVTTDGAGQFSQPVPSGLTKVDVVDATLPANLTLTTDSNGEGSDYTMVTVPSGGSANDNTGYVAAPAGTTGTVDGTVYEDVNGNGIFDAGDTPLAGVEVEITTSEGGIITVVTDGSGQFSATVPAGSTIVDVVDSTLPSGLTLTTDSSGEGSDFTVVNVPAGGSVTDNTGYVAAPAGTTGIVNGTVYEDVNGNGIFDAGDTPLVGVEVEITTSEGGVMTVVTDGAGLFSAVVPAGSTIVDVVDSTLPAGLSLTTDASGEGSDFTVVNVPANGSATDNTGYVSAATGSVGGTIYQDMNGNGLFDAGDVPLAGVEVIVTTADGGVLTLVTDAAGQFSATVAAGSTIVDVVDGTLPANLTLTTDTNGEGSDYTVVTVPAGGSATDNTGYVAAPAGTTGTVDGTVYEDVNGNGVFDAGDTPLAGVEVEITTSEGGLITVVTDGSGHFSAVVPAGSTIVDVVDSTLPAGLSLTTDASGEGSDFTVVNVPANGSVTDNTGYVSAATGSVGGTIYQDMNGNGLFDAGDVPLAGVEVIVTTADGGVITLVTDAAGQFSATVAAGSTIVDVVDGTLPANLTLTTDTNGEGSDYTVVTVPAGGSATDNTGYVAAPVGTTGTVDGTVYQDLNGNGVFDAGDTPLVGVEVEITTSEGGIITVVTDGAGHFSAVVPAGSTLIDVVDSTLPVGLTLTTDASGEGSDATLVNVPAGGSVTDNTGYVAVAPATMGSVDGVVYQDMNGNGLFDAGDVPLAGVEVQISSPLGGVILLITDGAGYFSSPVPAGSAIVDVVDSSLPAGLALTTDVNGEGSDYTIVTVPSGGNVTDNTGYVAVLPAVMGTLDGRVYHDVDGDGQWLSGTDIPLAGIAVEVTTSEAGLINLITAADGTYSTVVPSGSTTVDVVDGDIPAGLVLTVDTFGQGHDPAVVNVPAAGSATVYTGYADPVVAALAGPSGVKTATATLPVIHWRIVWINDQNAVPLLTLMSDPIPVHTTYVPGSLLCAPAGSSTVVNCSYDAVNNQIVYEGVIGPDLGAADETQANNEVVITYRTLLTETTNQVENIAYLNWDSNDDGSVVDDMGSGQLAVAASSLLNPNIAGIPLMPPLLFVFMAGGVLLFGLRLVPRR